PVVRPTVSPAVSAPCGLGFGNGGISRRVDMPFDLTAGEWSSLLQGLARGEYEVLLGAGASLGATGGDGRPLPDGKTLAKELAMDFAVDTADDDVDLRTIYE